MESPFALAARKGFSPAIAIVIWLLVSWIGTAWMMDSRSANLIAHRTDEARQQNARLQSEVARTLAHLHSLPALLADEPEIGAPLQQPGRRALLDNANRELQLAVSIMNVSEAFLLDRDGLCIASSNWAAADSFIGTRYAEREYFRSAAQGKPGYQFAVGKKSGIPGLYFSAPVTRGERLLGVAVLKVNLPALTNWIASPAAVISDRHGVVILAADHALEMHRLPGADVMALPQSVRLNRYQRDEIPPLPLSVSDKVAGTTLYRLGDSDTPLQWLHSSSPNGELQLNELQSLPSLAHRTAERLQVFLLAAALGVALIMLVKYRIDAWREHAQDEFRLRDSEQRYHFLFENNPLPMWVFDEKTLHFLEVNDSAVAHYGYSRAEFAQLTLRDIRPAEGVPLLDQTLNNSVGRKVRTLTRHRKKNGEVIEVLINAMPMEYRGQPARMALLEDVTERVHAERRLQRQLAFARALNEIARVVVEHNTPTTLLEGVARHIGDTLDCDRALIYDVSFSRHVADGMAEWLNPAQPEIVSTKACYPLDIFYAGADEIRRTRRPLVSHRDDMAAALRSDGSGELLHDQMMIGSLLWYPVAFHDDGYYLLTLNYLSPSRHWDAEELAFLDSASQMVGVALEKIRLLLQQEAAANDLRIAATAFESQEGMIITDAHNRILRVNKAFTRITGYTLEEVHGQNPRLLAAGRQDAEFYRAMWRQLRTQGNWEGEIWNRRKNGETYPEYLTVSVVRNLQGDITHYVGSFADITARKQAEEEVRSLAFYDPLTHLPNRRLLLDRVQQSWAGTLRNKRGCALLFIDLDNFKNLNDTLGHDYGDLLLQQVARRLEACIRSGDTVARMGGDEFVVMLEDLSADRIEAAEQTEVVAEKILAALNLPYQLAGTEYHNTPSIGATLFHDHQHNPEELFKHADIAMYQAKKAGKNTLRFFDPQMQQIISARATLEHEMRNGLEQREFELYYQLQVDEQRRPRGAEALIRWNHPKLGQVSPAHFIPLAEECGLIVPLGRWVLETACAQLKIWQDVPATRHLQLAVNVSAKQFRQPDFAQQVMAIVRANGVDPTGLKLELTESMLLDNTADIVTTMSTLREFGVQFSLDDFGTGYSSLQYLKKLPLDQLKIDQSFVRDLIADASDRAIVRTIIAMALELGLDVIAEGVEEETQLDLLRDKGCTRFQGYLFYRPQSAHQLAAQLAA